MEENSIEDGLLEHESREKLRFEGLPYCDIGVGEGVAHNVGSEGEVVVEFGEGLLQLLEVGRLKRLGAVLPLLYLGV